MRFHPDCYYKHPTGRYMHTLHIASTFYFGVTLLAEDDLGRVVPIGIDSDDYAENWIRITEEEWLVHVLPDQGHEAFIQEAANDALLQ